MIIVLALTFVFYCFFRAFMFIAKIASKQAKEDFEGTSKVYLESWHFDNHNNQNLF